MSKNEKQNKIHLKLSLARMMMKRRFSCSSLFWVKFCGNHTKKVFIHRSLLQIIETRQRKSFALRFKSTSHSLSPNIVTRDLTRTQKVKKVPKIFLFSLLINYLVNIRKTLSFTKLLYFLIV